MTDKNLNRPYSGTYPMGPIPLPYPDYPVAPPIGFEGLNGNIGGSKPSGASKMGFHVPPHAPISPPGEERRAPVDGETFGETKAFNFSEKSIRRAFTRKVYGIVSIQLLLTTSLIALLSLHEGVKAYVRDSPGFVGISYIFSFVVLIPLMCCESVRRQMPYNVILLGLFTLTYGLVIGVIASQYEVTTVALAAVITTVLTLGLTAFAFQTKIDFTVLGGVLFCCLLILFILGIITSFFPQISYERTIFACLGALLFSCYLIYDTQLMIGGDHKFSISPEEYIFAALNIYLDIIMIFLYILRMLNPRN